MTTAAIAQVMSDAMGSSTSVASGSSGSTSAASLDLKLAEAFRASHFNGHEKNPNAGDASQGNGHTTPAPAPVAAPAPAPVVAPAPAPAPVVSAPSPVVALAPILALAPALLAPSPLLAVALAPVPALVLAQAVVAAPAAPVTVAAAPSPAATAAPAPTATTWQKIAGEGQAFSVTATSTVRFGALDRWATKSISGAASCSSAFFGFDPYVNQSKQCDVMIGTAAPAPMKMPVIDATKLPPSNPGFSGPRVMAANVSNSSQVPNTSDLGAFREPCDFSHMSFDDPIVFPGQPGKSHLHAFFGNTGTNASTTATSLASTGNSTCAGGTLNRTAYWVPAVIDTRTGAPVTPSSSIFYYKTGYLGIVPSTIKPFPAGLRMVSGDPSNSIPAGTFNYGCVGPVNSYWADHNIPACATGEDMIMSVDFPNCWDGVNLDSPDHISHMTRPVNGSCPATHPVPLPEIGFVIHYTIKSTDAPLKWRLSSDNYDPSLPGGYSGHGDWFNGWDPATMNTFVKYCEQAAMDCHAYLLGDGRTLY